MPFAHSVPEGPLRLDVEPVAADLWAISIPAFAEAAGAAALWCSPEELARAVRIVPESGRARFLIVRAAVREILSRYAPGRQPRDLRFSRGPFGKPRLLDSTIAFNVSHTRTAAVCCVARDEVGVDLEHVRPVRDLLRIARTFFTGEEVAAIMSQPGPARPRVFLRLWTRKEACAKALGLGLALPFWSFAAGPGGSHESVRELRAGGRSLSVRTLPTGARWVAALASFRDGVERLRLWRYAPASTVHES